MANPPPPKMPDKPKKATAAWRLKLGMAIPWLLAATVVALLIQVYLAGAGLFGDAAYLDTHGAFGSIVLHVLPLLIALAGFLGADWRVGVVGIVLMVQMEAQYALIDATGGFVQALHPLNGVLMLTVTLATFMRRLPWAKKSLPAPAPSAKPMVSLRPAAPPVQTANTPRPPAPPQR